MDSRVSVEDRSCADEDEFDVKDEESRTPLRLRQVVGPTARERSKHDRLHLPYRSWCPVCVAGRGVNHGHHQVRDELGEQAPEVSFDYCFLRDQPGCDSLPVLVGFDRASRSVIAHAVPFTGADECWTAQQVCRDLKRFGHHGRVLCGATKSPHW